jgi:hypothetical protein
VGVFSLGRWASRVPTGFHGPRGTWVHYSRAAIYFDYGTFPLSGVGSHQLRLYMTHVTSAQLPLCPVMPRNPIQPTTAAFQLYGLDYSLVARRYWGNRVCFLFLQVLRCFSFPRLQPLPMDSGRVSKACPLEGFPIRKSPDHRVLTASRGLSQLATSFFASTCQGIHRMLFITLTIGSLKDLSVMLFSKSTAESYRNLHLG